MLDLSTFSTETLIKDNTFAHVFLIWQQQTLISLYFCFRKNFFKAFASPPCTENVLKNNTNELISFHLLFFKI